MGFDVNHNQCIIMTSKVNKSERTNMKVSKTQVKENRDKIVEKATQLFRSKGYDGVGIAELMSSAGLLTVGFINISARKQTLLLLLPNMVLSRF